MIDFAPSSGVQEAHCLLEWIHTFPNSHSITCLADVNHSSLIVDILKDLDDDLYKTLLSGDIEGSVFAWQLSRYLLKHFQKGVIILNSYSIQELVSKLLYVCVHSKKKQTYIQKILNLDDKVQVTLMKLIEKTQNQIVVVKQSSLILDKIADLQAANQQLQDTLHKSKSQYQKLHNLLEATKVELKAFEEECQKYRKEKEETMRELEIIQFSNYISVYRKIEQENHQSFNTMKDLESKVLKLDEDNKNLKQKIIQDGAIISKYHEDSHEMKQTLKKLKSIKRKNQFMGQESDIIDEKSISSSYVYIVKEMESHIATQKEKYSKQVGEYHEQMSMLVNENNGLRKMTKYLSGQIGLLEKVYKQVRQVVPV